MKALPRPTPHLEISVTLLLTTHIIHILSISALIHLDHMKLMMKILATGMYLKHVNKEKMCIHMTKLMEIFAYYTGRII